MKIEEVLSQIKPLDEEWMQIARERQENLTKPPGSLGYLEEISIRLCGIKGEVPKSLGKKVVILCAGDHGVVEEGVSAYPQEVTTQMLLNFAHGGAAISVLSRHVGADVVLVDVGAKENVDHPAILSKKVKNGTFNFTKGEAMSREEAESAIEVGLEVAVEEIKKGAGIIATGDMGIGNTTASSALISFFTGFPVRSVVGKGTGIDDSAFEKKVQVIEKAIEVNKPDPDDPIDVLAKLGGLEIAALIGVMIAGAIHRVPVVIDGFISGAAALIAVRIAPQVKDYLFPSHLSEEPGHCIVLEEIGFTPFLHLKMRLGEGTGAVLAMQVIEAAVKILSEMRTFEEAGVAKGKEEEVQIEEVDSV